MNGDIVQCDPTVREVVADLVQARDAQITRVVAMVDELPERGRADALIAPLRARLAQLRPTRPFGFTRLLFSPLDTVIVPGPRWKRGEVGIPRPALAALGSALQAAIPELSQSLEPGACRVAPDDRLAIAALGRNLWPAAAAALERMDVPANWTQASGLVANDFAELASVIVAVLRLAPDIEALASSRSVDQDASIRSVLALTERHGGLALATMVTVLLGRLPVPARVLAVAAEAANVSRCAAADHAMDHTLTSLQASMAEGAVDNGTATEAAAEATRIAAMLAGLEDGGTANPERRRRLDHIRKEADALCRKRFDRAIKATMNEAGEAAASDGGDESLINLENAARDLRRLESAGRRLGSGDHYDLRVQTISARFRDEASGLGLADRVRIVEILAGPDEALALLLAKPS